MPVLEINETTTSHPCPDPAEVTPAEGLIALADALDTQLDEFIAHLEQFPRTWRTWERDDRG